MEVRKHLLPNLKNQHVRVMLETTLWDPDIISDEAFVKMRNTAIGLGRKGQVQIRVQICPTRSMFSKFNYFDIVASLHKYACYRINKNPYHGHLWITEAREK